jgi:lysine 2,3-aminomutase
LNLCSAPSNTLSPKPWAKELSEGLISPHQFHHEGFFDEETHCKAQTLRSTFDFRLPARFVEPSKSDPSLANQFVPKVQELDFAAEELVDPIGDERWTPTPGITHRYHNRALLKVTYQCASYCRFCFRRYKVSDAQFNLSTEELELALVYLERHPEIVEVILTGGDPLVLTDSKLFPILRRLSGINHLKMIRIHSRIPTVLPSRVTPDLLQILGEMPQQVFLVAHVNSASEVDENVKKVLRNCKKAGLTLLSQSVLLKGVNATPKQLIELFSTMIESGVIPYYLHYPDLAKGTQHFRVPLEQAVHLMQELQGKISGFAIPTLVVDIPGGHGKVPADSRWTRQLGPYEWEFTSPLDGQKVRVNYPNTI